MMPLAPRPSAKRTAAPAWQPLETLARADAVVAPLAHLHVEVLGAEHDAPWDASALSLTHDQLSDGVPLLHGQTLNVDARRFTRLLLQLAERAARAGTNHAESVTRALKAHALHVRALVESSITQNDRVFAESGVDAALLATLTQLAALPLLRACAHQAAPLLNQLNWNRGYCPVCAGWATLAELRGLERQRWLRCGRCASEWRFALQRCYVCGNEDYRMLGYLAPEAEREARQATTCDGCRSYLKTFTTVGALTPAELIHKDLSSLELDVAALEHNYTRPSQRAFPMEVHITMDTSRR